MTSLVVQTVKRLSTMRETQVQSLGGEDPLEKEMASHSSTLAWKIPWTEEPAGLQPMELQRIGHNCVTTETQQHLLLSSSMQWDLDRNVLIPQSVSLDTSKGS